MPDYRWIAVDMQGQEHYGVQWAASEQQLLHDLLKNNLTVSAMQRVRIALVERLSGTELVQFFEQLQQLFEAGLLIAPSLAIMARYGSSLRCKIARELHACVQHGMCLADALEIFPACFSTLIVTFVRAGVQAGALAQALAQLCEFLRMRQNFKKQLWASLAMPLVTFIFFLLVALVIFIGIVPSLENVVQMLNKAPTGALANMFLISNWLRSLQLFGIISTLLIVVGSTILIVRIKLVQYAWQWLLLRLPLVGTVYCSFVLALFLHAVALLLRGGQSLVSAIEVASVLVANYDMCERINCLRQEVAAGIPIATAFSHAFGRHALVACVALLEVGNQSGTLAVVLDRCASIYAQRSLSILKRITLVAQPLFMIIIGLLIAGLMYAVYVPLMQMPLMIDNMH